MREREGEEREQNGKGRSVTSAQSSDGGPEHRRERRSAGTDEGAVAAVGDILWPMDLQSREIDEGNVQPAR